MKRLIIFTVILLAAMVGITVVYFKNLSPQGQRAGEVMHTIPANAALIFEFNNDDGFYDIFKGNTLFTSIIGPERISDLDVLRKQLLQNAAFSQYFTGQNIFISIHPLQNNHIDLLLTASAGKGFNLATLDELAKKTDHQYIVAETIAGKKCYVIYLKELKKRFYLINKDDGILAGSFSKDLIIQSIQNDPKKDAVPYTLIPDQQNSNSLANLYVNYAAFNPLFQQLFTNKNTDIFKSFRLFSGLSALTLNFKNDAVMFSGLTDIPKNTPIAYLNLFLNQQAVVNDLKNIFPSTTAYSINFAVSDPQKFKADLSAWQAKAGMQHQKDSLFKKIKSETGINLISEFNQLLGNEFAMVTTRYQEKLAIIALKNGSALRPVFNNISTAQTDKIGQLNYDRVPALLLGDAFNILKRPYYMIVDNYLIMANSTHELISYYDTYFNRKFLSKLSEYNHFDNLVSERSNVSFFINFKNTQPELKRDMNAGFYNLFEQNEPGWKNYYAASCQLVTSGKRFYTNFCMSIDQPDTTQ